MKALKPSGRSLQTPSHPGHAAYHTGLVSWLFLHPCAPSDTQQSNSLVFIYLCIYVVEVISSVSSKRAGVGSCFARYCLLGTYCEWHIMDT